MTIKTVKLEDELVSYRDDAETHQAVFNKLVEFCKEHHCFSGESFMQRDAPQIGAQELMCDLLDGVLKFEVRCAGDDGPHQEGGGEARATP